MTPLVSFINLLLGRCFHGRKFHLTVGGDNKYKIYHEQFFKGTQIIQSNCTYKDMSPQ